MSCCSSSRTVSPVSRPPQKTSGAPQANAATTQQGIEESQPRQGPQSIYEFVVKGHKASPHDMRQYEGKPILCMNVASKCSFAKNGYESATELFEKYKDRGFVVLAFPCNQFGSQEPDSDDEIKKFACKKYKAGFPIMSKCDVNGPKAEPLWEYMKNEKRGIFNSASIKWNFTSFLCDRNGKPIKRYSPGAKAAEIEEDLIPILEAGERKEEDKTGGEAPVGIKAVENSASDHTPALEKN